MNDYAVITQFHQYAISEIQQILPKHITVKLVDYENRLIKIKPPQILYKFSCDNYNQLQQSISKFRESIDIELLYTMLDDDTTPTSIKDLHQLYFGENDNIASMIALLMSLSINDHLFSNCHDGRFRKYSLQERQQLFNSKQKKQQLHRNRFGPAGTQYRTAIEST